MKIILSTFLLSLTTVWAFAQEYSDYIGAGHSEGITVTSSSNLNEATAEKTITGDGMDAVKMEASRFLAQSTLGTDLELVNEVAEMGIENWLEEQLNQPVSLITPVMRDLWKEIFDLRVANGENPDEIFGPYALHFNYAWWQNIMEAEDMVRQRVALALSEILVISINSELGTYADALTSYYDVLLNHAFGNYEDLLLDVTLHESMGYYLSHLNNSRAFPGENNHPDENYAREIMQLFTIGLFELNPDGTQKLDGNGNPIPTYDNNDIKELAKVFTGLGPGEINMYVTWTNEPYFGLGIWGSDMTVPMKMYPLFHEPSEKVLLGGAHVIPANQDGMTDIREAVSFLFNHPNVGPFLASRLIQRLVKSNPTPEYIRRIAAVFDDNGQGVRGDLKAVVKAILLDEEARSCEALMDPDNGKLREPILRYTQVAKSFPTDSPYGRFWNNGYYFLDQVKQHPLASPTVFNFYLPNHQPVGEIADAGLVAPEFKIHNTSTSINFINNANIWFQWNALWWSWESDIGDVDVSLITEELEELADDPEILINDLDIRFTHGLMSDATRTNIRNALEGLIWGDYRYDRARLALYLTVISPDYAILR